MYKKFIFLLLISLQAAYSQQTEINGTVLDKENNPVPFAHIIIEKLNIGASANDEGKFKISKIPIGLHNFKISAVGYVTLHKQIDFNEKSALDFNFKLENDSQLEQVEVFGNRFKHPDKIEALTRLPLEPYEQIQSISVISEKVIQDQGALTISETTKNVPGVYTFSTYGNKRESMSSRGFRGIPILKNGVRIHSDFRGVGVLTDMQGVDNIQVLKGAASITQGVATDLGSPGGVINIVTKTPKYEFGGNATFRAGSFGQIRPAFDVYGPLNEQNTVAFRLNTAIERADNYRDGVSFESFYINPSLLWKTDDKTTVTLELDYFDDSRTPDIGTVNLAENDVNAIYNLQHNMFLGFKNDRSITKNSTYAIRFDRVLSEKLTLKGAFYKSNLDLDEKGASLGTVITENNVPVYNLRKRGYSISTRSDNNTVIQFDLIGDELATGKIKHTFQVGFDYRITDFSTFSQSINNVDVINVFQNNTNSLPIGTKLGTAVLANASSKSLGFVAQDVITFSSWFKTFLGLRFSTTETINTIENNTSNAFNPLGGLIISPIENLNIFVSYTNSSYPRTASRLSADGKELGNERYDQLEAGIKTNWLNNRLRFNLTLFKINNKDINLPVYDENWVATGFFQKGGNDQRQGIEIELTGRILENLEIITGYSYIDAQYKEHTSYVFGSAPLNTPKHTANIYFNYYFRGKLEGLSLGSGTYYTGERPINDWSSGPVTHEGIVPHQKPFYVEAYTLVNIQAGYKFSDNWDIRFLVNNVFDKIGYNAYRTSHINQTNPQTFAGVLAYKF